MSLVYKGLKKKTSQYFDWQKFITGSHRKSKLKIPTAAGMVNRFVCPEAIYIYSL